MLSRFIFALRRGREDVLATCEAICIIPCFARSACVNALTCFVSVFLAFEYLGGDIALVAQVVRLRSGLVW